MDRDKYNQKAIIHDIKCPVCGKHMVVDDVDYKFAGNEDIYFICEEHYTSKILRIRYGKLWKIE